MGCGNDFIQAFDYSKTYVKLGYVRRATIAPILSLGILFPIMGCVTHHWLSPPIDGQITDSTNGKPISGVEVFMIPQNGHGETERVCESDSKGHFKGEARRKTIIGIPFLVYLGDYWNKGQFVLKKEGYAPLAFDYSSPAQNFGAEPNAAPDSLRMTPLTKQVEQ
jgi:hypothetical protein